MIVRYGLSSEFKGELGITSKPRVLSSPVFRRNSARFSSVTVGMVKTCLLLLFVAAFMRGNSAIPKLEKRKGGVNCGVRSLTPVRSASAQSSLKHSPLLMRIACLSLPREYFPLLVNVWSFSRSSADPFCSGVCGPELHEFFIRPML